MSEDHVSGQAENPRIGSTTIPDEFLNECPMSDGPIYACDHCRKNGTFDPSRYSFKPASEIKVDYGPQIPLGQKTSNLSAGVQPGMVGKYIRSEQLDDLALQRLVEQWKENGRTSPNTRSDDRLSRYARHPLASTTPSGMEPDRNPSQTKFNPVDEAFQQGRFGKGRPGMENPFGGVG